MAETHTSIAAKHEIIRIVNGSKLYGTQNPESDDDAMAVFVEPREYVFSDRKIETALLHDRHPQAKSSVGEIDGIAHSVRHFIKLALDGNPSILTVLFAPSEFWLNTTSPGGLLMNNSELFVSMNAAPRFKGYMHAQMLRLKGIKAGHIPNRPELVEKYGYDVKYAMSVARLAIQGIEFFQTGKIESPMNSMHIDFLTGMRHGSHTYEEAILNIEELEKHLLLEIEKSKLPEKPEYAKIYQLSEEIHNMEWNENLI